VHGMHPCTHADTQTDTCVCVCINACTYQWHATCVRPFATSPPCTHRILLPLACQNTPEMMSSNWVNILPTVPA